MKIESWPLDKIIVPPQTRTHSKEWIRQLAESLMGDGQLQPCGVLANGTLVWGFGRHAAAKFTAEINPAEAVKHLVVVVLDRPMKEGEWRSLRFIENHLREDMTPFEKFAGLKDILASEPGMTQKELASRVKIDPTLLSRILSLDKCIPAVRAAAEANDIAISDWATLSALSENEQAEALALRLAGGLQNRNALKQHAKRKQQGDKPAAKVSRMKLALASGATITAVSKGLTLEGLLDALADAQRQVRKAISDGLNARTFQDVLRDKAKAGRQPSPAGTKNLETGLSPTTNGAGGGDAP